MENEEITIDILDLLKHLLKKWWLLAIVTIAVGVVVFCVSYFYITPTYSADIMLYVNNTSNTQGSNPSNISNSELSAAQSLVDTYIVILQSRTTYDSVCEQSGETFSFNQYKDMIQAAAVNNTEIFRVKVTTTNPNRSATIANAIASVLPTIIGKTVDGSSVRVVQYAEVPTTQAAPNCTKNAMIGMIVGFLLCAFIIVLRKVFDDSIRDEDYFAQAYPDIPLLSVIPDISTGKRYGKSYYRKHYYKTDYASKQNVQEGGHNS